MNSHATFDLERLAAANAAQATRAILEMRDARITGQRARFGPRPVIGASWDRMLATGVDPERDFRSGVLSTDEVERRRQASPLRAVLPVLREGLLSVADVAQHIMVIADADGRLLWREGNRSVLRMADGHGFDVGADWRETVVGTNGVGTSIVTRRPVQVFAAEHFVRSHHPWTCTGAPITDPRDGRLLGVVDISGPLDTMHPATLALVCSVAKLAESRLREGHLTALDRLRSVAAPLLARLDGRAVAVDAHGWTAAVTGMPPVDRVTLPKSLTDGRAWLPSLGRCAVAPLPGGWLLRVEDDEAAVAATSATTRVVVDVSGAHRWSVTVTGSAGCWTHELSPRHAELLYLLGTQRAGRSAAGLAADLFGDPGRTVTVRAELSRVRRYLGGLVAHRPYRFHEEADVDLVLPDDVTRLLPHSMAPAVIRARAGAVP
ncbi:GAF domain-containing protein [Streptomyces sp. AN091965]|uniref:GAF domain-containing protein n=1 Tax=Streptomyces sp. AN091965 TaxID=2927803 RepID=UPI001F60DC8C|nr:GAF domain-containing protein [Streptomyces sp. AN091965]MCI3933746.1 GAF domain-containing protein [Streptomyces sp. AN091965]